MRRRILLGLTPIFILIVAMGAYAVLLFAELGTRVDVILRENFRSVLAGQQMKEASERIDSGLFFSLVGEEERGRNLYRENVPVFLEALRIESSNVTLPGEDKLAAELRRLHEAYAARAEAFWQTSDFAARRERRYFGELLPLFTQIKDTAQKIISINQDAMVKADRDARDLSARSTRHMLVASGLGIAAALFFAARLQKGILTPIQAITAVSKELGEGKLDQIVPVESKDELGELADAFNKMAARLRSYRQTTSDQILQARQMTEITFSAFPDAILAFSPEGRVTFNNPAANRLLRNLAGNGAGLPASVLAQVDQLFKGGPDYLPESLEKAIVVRVNDQERFLLPRVIGMRDEGDRLFGAAVVLQDVTRFRLLDEVKSNLVSTVSHELKTPLTSVRMGLHLLLEERIGPLNAKQTELLLAAREESERLLRMINDLLDIARLESGRAACSARTSNRGPWWAALKWTRARWSNRGARTLPIRSTRSANCLRRRPPDRAPCSPTSFQRAGPLEPGDEILIAANYRRKCSVSGHRPRPGIPISIKRGFSSASPGPGVGSSWSGLGPLLQGKSWP